MSDFEEDVEAVVDEGVEECVDEGVEEGAGAEEDAGDYDAGEGAAEAEDDFGADADGADDAEVEAAPVAAVAPVRASKKRSAPTGDGAEGEHVDVVREQDRFLPVANMSRIMRRVLPPNAKVTKEAKEAIQESVSEFISFVTSEASDKCMAEKRKTINGDDVLWAMGTLGFREYVDPLRLYLSRFRDTAPIANSAGAGGGAGGAKKK